MTALFILFLVALLALIVVVVLYFYFRRKSAKSEEAPQPDTDEISLLVHAAESKLVNARLPEGSKVGNLPVYLLMGNSASTKTSVMVHSGLDPELLAGQVYQNLDIVPTRGARAVAPACRSCCHELAIEVEPPVSCSLPPDVRLP